MEQTSTIPQPNFFTAHPNLSDQVNANIIGSEVEGGVYLRDLPCGTALTVQTTNRFYTLISMGEEGALISGHPEFCPQPILVRVQGSTWGGSILKSKFLGRGMHMEFEHPVYRTVITSPIVDIRAC